ncbi:hypothetical protein V5H05_19010 [Vibrio cholerae]|uniref:hypothetical protein n=1 Tax=Vibrio cholerae TaxID=666 RepID=UPI0039678633
MKEAEIYSYYAFGFNYRYIRAGLEGKTNKEVYDDITSLYLDEIKGLELQVTLQVISDLEDIVEMLATLPEDDVIDSSTAKKLNLYWISQMPLWMQNYSYVRFYI